MITNGQTGQFFSGIRQPFVYSLVPVIPTGGAFFSAPNPAFHQQYSCPGTVAERVLRGDLVLRDTVAPATKPMGHETPAAKSTTDPATIRSNVAFAWFSESSSNVPENSVAGSVTAPSSGIVKPQANPAGNAPAPVQQKPEDAPAAAAMIVAEADATDSASQKIAEVYFQRGLEAAAQQDTAKARFLFDMAARRASGDLSKRISERFAEIEAR